ncbi:MAG: hypothetical protein OSJ61_20805 [Lachnospiraceae bacterium]|nr:hypothetical protein [Lachnospiraceae bacterium]
MLKYWGIKTGKRFFFARFYMHTPMQRKYAIAWRIGGARVVKMNLLYSIAQPHAEEVCRKSGAGGAQRVVEKDMRCVCAQAFIGNMIRAGKGKRYPRLACVSLAHLFLDI